MSFIHHLVVLVVVVALLTAVFGVAVVASLRRSNGSAQGGNGMWKSITRVWKYLAVKLRLAHEELADPKVQLEQAIDEARAQHRRLTEQAANVIANQQQVQQRLDRVVAEYAKTQASTRQALVLADQQRHVGDTDKAVNFENAAESFAARLLDLEAQVRDLQGTLLEATAAADGAKAAVTQNAAQLRDRLQQRERLLSDLDRARMQEQMNRATAQLSAQVGADVPTFAEVERKINDRLLRARAAAELEAAQTVVSVDAQMIEVERARRSAEAQGRLAAMRASLGLAAPDAPALPRVSALEQSTPEQSAPVPPPRRT
jgi:phage shock protein A